MWLSNCLRRLNAQAYAFIYPQSQVIFPIGVLKKSDRMELGRNWITDFVFPEYGFRYQKRADRAIPGHAVN